MPYMIECSECRYYYRCDYLAHAQKDRDDHEALTHHKGPFIWGLPPDPNDSAHVKADWEARDFRPRDRVYGAALECGRPGGSQ